MKINHTNIKALKPCDSRYENFKKHYPEFDSDLTEFLYLEEISYSDKVWVFTRLATKEQNIKWAIMCAESVLQHFETKYPQDLRPRIAIEAAEAYVLNPTEENKTAYADNAVNAATNAVNAATNAANAATNAANAATNAVNAAAYAAHAAYAAAYAAHAAANAAHVAYAAANAAYAANVANAVNAANVANAAYAAHAAANVANAVNAATNAAHVAYAVNAEKQQEQLNLMFMIEATS